MIVQPHLRVATNAFCVWMVCKMFVDASTDYLGALDLEAPIAVLAISFAWALWIMPFTVRLAFAVIWIAFNVFDVLTFGPSVFLSSVIPWHPFNPNVIPTGYDRRALLGKEEIYETLGALLAFLIGFFTLVSKGYRRLRRPSSTRLGSTFPS